MGIKCGKCKNKGDLEALEELILYYNIEKLKLDSNITLATNRDKSRSPVAIKEVIIDQHADRP